LDKRILSVHVSLEVIGVLERQPFFQRAICLCVLGMGDHVIAEGQMARSTDASCLKCMHLMCAGTGGVVLAEVAASGNAELAHHFVTQLFHRATTRVQIAEIIDLHQNVDDWLG